MTEADFMATLKKMIKSQPSNIDFYEVVSYTTDVNTNKINLQVRKILEKTSEQHIITNGIGLGNNKGIVSGYEVGDILLCLRFNGELIILTSLYNQFYSQKDTVLLPQAKELIINAGSGAKIKFEQDGGIKLRNVTNHGIDISSTGAVTIRGTSVNFTQSAGDDF